MHDKVINNVTYLRRLPQHGQQASGKTTHIDNTKGVMSRNPPAFIAMDKRISPSRDLGMREWNTNQGAPNVPLSDTQSSGGAWRGINSHYS